MEKSHVWWRAAAGLLGVVFGAAQVALVVQQNTIMERQNALVVEQREFLAAQTRANELQAISQLLLALDPKDSVRTEVAVTLLGLRGERAIDIVRQLRRQSGPAEGLAADILGRQSSTYDVPTTLAVLHDWTEGELVEFIPFGSSDNDVFERWQSTYVGWIERFLEGAVMHATKDSLFFRLWQSPSTQDQFRRDIAPLFEHFARRVDDPIRAKGTSLLATTLRLCRVSLSWKEWGREVEGASLGGRILLINMNDLRRLGWNEQMERKKPPPSLPEACAAT